MAPFAAMANAAGTAPTEGWTRTSHWQRKPDGRVEVKTYASPVFARRGSSWQRVNATLQSTGSATLPFGAPDALLPTSFGVTAGRVVEIALPGGPVRLTAPGLRIGVPDRDGNVVTYRDVANDTDLQVEVTARGLRTQFVLKSDAAPTSFSLRIDDPEGQLGDVRESEGGWEFTKTVDRDLVLRASPGFAYEQSAAADGAPVGVEPGSARLDIRKEGTAFVLDKSVDPDWLAGKTFPVVLDPFIYWDGPSRTVDCHIVSGSRATTNYCGSTTWEIGYHTADAMIRRLPIKFLPDVLPEGATVDAGSAFLGAHVNLVSPATTSAPTYHVYEFNTSWTTAVTWTKRNSTTNWTTPGGNWNTTRKGIGVVEPVQDSWGYFDLDTAMVQNWARGGTNNGMMVKASSETTQTLLRFTASEWADTYYAPYLGYSYTDAPTAPGNVTAIPDRARALVSWSAATEQGDTIAKYLVKAVCDSAGCPAETQVYECNSSCRSQWVYVQGGYNYRFEVRAQDVAGRSGPAGTSASTYVRSNLPPITPDNLLPANGSKLRSYPQECGRYYDPESDPGTILVDIRRADGSTVATNVATTVLTSNTNGCVSQSIGEGEYEWDAVATDGLLTSGRTGVQTFLIDNSAPLPPSLSSSTHPDQSAWYTNPNVTVGISASDLSGITGHSYQLDTTPGTLPDEVVDTASSSLSMSLADGDRYLHVRSCNGVALCSAVSDYRLRVDTTAPSVPTITSLSHTQSAWSNDNTVTVNWSATDATSGVYGYRTAFTQTSTYVPTNMNNTGVTQTSSPLSDGDWWFHIATVDRAGNVSGVVHRGPFKIKTVLPGTPTLSSTTHTDSVWSPNASPRFVWSATDASGIVGYSYSLDTTFGAVPDTTVDTGLTEATISAPDGTRYFHVRALDGAGNWSAASTFTLLVDATAPVLGALTSSTHPGETTWYSTSSPALSWSATDTSGITGYSYVLDQVATTTPDGVSEGSAVSKSYTALADGIWYFHVRPINGTGLVGAVVHRAIRIDTTAPASPSVTSSHSSTTWSQNRTVSFSWTQPGDVSGIAGYAVVFDQALGTIPSPVVTTTTTSTSFANVADGTHYLHVRPVNGALLWGTTTTYRVLVDATGTSLTSLTSSTHPSPTTWYSADDVTVSFAATDLSGIAGYSYALNQSPTSLPDGVVDTTATSLSWSNLPDGTWYVHVLPVNGSGLAGATTTFTVLIDDTVPSVPTVTSPDHPVGMTTNQRVVTLDWSGAPGSDLTSGLAGYHVAFTQSATPVTTSSVSTTSTSFTSASLADGTWFAHVRGVDRAGNASTVFVYGPIGIDPNAPPVSDAERDRFVTAWKPRVTSETFGPAYLQTPGYPAEILLEGFHGYNPIQKAYLVDQLWAVLRAENPPPTEVQITEDAARNEVYDFVYAKEKFLLDPLPSDLVDNVVRSINPEIPILQPRLDALELGRGIDLDLPDLALPELPDLGAEEVVSDVEDTLEPVTQDATAALTAETNAALSALQNGLLDTLDTVASEVMAVAADTVALDTSAVFGLVNALPVEAGYQVCFETASRGGCQNVAVLGLPGLVDLSGDGTPDVTATFMPSVNASNAVGVGFSLDVRRATTPNDMSDKALNAHVWAVYDVPLYNSRFRIGFDGMKNGGQLSEATVLNLTVKDPTKLAERDFLTAYSLTHTTPSARPWALTMGIQNITGDADSTAARIQYAPPKNATGDLDLVNDDTDAVRDRDIRFTSDLATDDDVTLTISAREVVAARSETTNVTATIPKLPKHTSLTLHDEVPDADSRDLTLDLANSERAERVSAHVDVTRGSRRIRLLADLRNVPSTVTYHLANAGGDAYHTYTANGTLDSISAAAELFDSGVRQGTATLRAGTVPSWFTLHHTPDPQNPDLVLVDYTGGGAMTRLDATGFYRPELLTVKLSARDVPVLLSGEVDTKFRHVAFDTPTPITLLDVTVTKKTTRVSRLAGEHATIVTPGTGQFGLSARVANLTSGTFDMGSVLTADMTVVPGGQKFAVGGQIGTVFFHGEVSNLPATLHLVIDQPNLQVTYQGSAVVPRIRAYGGVRPGGPHVEATLTQVPTNVTLKATPGSTAGTLTYNANTALGSIERIVATSDGTVGDRSGTTIQGSITTVPRTMTLTADRSLKKFAFSGEQAVGDLDLTMSRNGARPQRAAQNHLTLTGTSSAWAVGVHIGNVKTATLDMSQGLTQSSAHLTLSAGGQQFIANGNLDGVRLYASVSNLPTSFGYVANGTQSLEYDTNTPITKLVLYLAKTGTGPTLRGQITGTPLSGTVTATIASPVYRVRFDGSGPSTGASGFYSSRYVDAAATATTDYVSGSVKGLPTWFQADVNTSTKQISFSSDRGMDEASAKAKGLLVNGLQAEALMRNLPASAHVHFDLNDALFDGQGGTIGYAFARGSNYQTPPKRMAGKHVYLRADLPRGYFDASAELTNLSYAMVKRTAGDIGLEGNVNLGTDKLGLDLRADFYPPGTSSGTAARVGVRGSVVGFPTDLTVSRTGSTVEYHADRTLDADLSVEMGYPTAINRAATPKARYGVSVTDGVCAPNEGCPTTRPDGQDRLFCQSSKGYCLGLKGRIVYNGLPKDVTLRLDAANDVFVTTSALASTTTTFSARADLDWFTPWPVLVDLTLNDVLPGTTLDVGPVRFGKTAQGGAHVFAELHANRDLGPMTFRVEAGVVLDFSNYRYRDFVASGTFAKVPKDFIASIGIGYETRLTLNSSSAILGEAMNIRAAALVQKKTSSGTYTTLKSRAEAQMRLFDLPASPTVPVDLRITFPHGDAQSGVAVVMPGITYSAPSSTLDGTISMDPEWAHLLLFDGLIDASVRNATIDFDNLSSSLSLAADPTTYNVDLETGVGAPKTTRFSVEMWDVDLNIDKDFSIDKKKPGVRLIADLDLDILLGADKVDVELTNVGSFHLRPGQWWKTAYGVHGDYGTFRTHLEGVRGGGSAQATIRVRPWPDWIWSHDVFKATLPRIGPFNVVDNVYSHVADADNWGTVGSCWKGGWGPTAVSAAFQIKPAPTNVREKNGVTLTGNGGRQVFFLGDPGWHPLLSNFIDIVIVAANEDPYDDGGWRVLMEYGDGACD